MIPSFRFNSCEFAFLVNSLDIFRSYCNDQQKIRKRLRGSQNFLMNKNVWNRPEAIITLYGKLDEILCHKKVIWRFAQLSSQYILNRFEGRVYVDPFNHTNHFWYEVDICRANGLWYMITVGRAISLVMWLVRILQTKSWIFNGVSKVKNYLTVEF